MSSPANVCQERRLPRAAAAAAIVTTFFASSAFACGYENPQTVALGSLNWIYPKALYVGTAVWQAEEVGLLPSRQDVRSEGVLGFYRAAASMKRLGTLLGDTPSDMHFSVVLIPQVMWTRFAPTGGGGVKIETHADGPVRGDVVIVTSEKVVRAIVDGTLGFSDAEAFGMLRLYGDDGPQARLQAALTRVLKGGAKTGDVAH